MRICNDFLQSVKTKYDKIISVFPESKKKSEVQNMFKEEYKFYNNPTNDILVECEELVESRKQEVYVLMDLALKRGESVDNLVRKADQMQSVSFEMRSKSRNLLLNTCLQNIWMILIIIFLLLLILVTFILLILYAVFKPFKLIK
jgi:hypothetical protein